MIEKKAHIHSDMDNVVVALAELKKGEAVTFLKKGVKTSIKVRESIPFAHKIAIVNIKAGGDVIKYGGFIGKAVSDIKVGDHVHTQNIKGVKYT